MGKRRVVSGIVIVLSFLAGMSAWADTADPAAVDALLKSLQGVQATEPVRVMQTPEGFVRFLGAPPGDHFSMAVPAAKAVRPADTAKAFALEHGDAFGLSSDKVSLTAVRSTEADGRTYIKLQQKYAGIGVFGAQMTVQLDDAGGVTSVLSDVMRDTASLDNGTVSTTPTVTGARAKELAIAYVTVTQQQKLAGGSGIEATEPELMLYDPAVLGQDGPVVLVWRLEVRGTGEEPLSEVVLLSAQSGTVVIHYSLVHDALQRTILDANFGEFGTLVRSEGQAATGIEDVDNIYDYLGDTYAFYADNHGRDSYDEQGSPLRATVRIGSMDGMPFENAFWSELTEAVYFGVGLVTDDIAAHELTHGVTQFSSGLIYMFQSGAINESFSDMWGEWVDLTNGRGNDAPQVRWLIGEDSSLGAIRNMQDPTEFGDPDRMSVFQDLPYYYDNGGVHFNSGIGNKLCYLLTDGGFFNGYSVEGLGIVTAAKLMYELQRNLLTPASDYSDLYAALYQASINIGLTFEQRLNVQAASLAVEIAEVNDAVAVRHFRATASVNSNNRPVVVLTWEKPTAVKVNQIIIVRKDGAFPTSPDDGNEIYRATGSSFVDGLNPDDPLTEAEYYYALYADIEGQLPQVAFARANTTGEAIEFITEAFSSENRFDLSYSQVLFSPVGVVAGSGPAGGVSGFGDYSNYAATIVKNVRALPVAKENYYVFPLTDDGYAMLNFGVFGYPLFGTRYQHFVVAANGYVAPLTAGLTWDNNYPSLAAHYDIPRISFLFADLNPQAQGMIWGRDMTDRWVVTFEHVPEYTYYGSPLRNTVQLEMFYSGHIRVTYLETGVTDAIVGLSDGAGVPPDPSDYVPGADSLDPATNLSLLPEGLPQQVSFWPPVGIQNVNPGEFAQFLVQTNSPNGVPRLSATWNGPGAAPFADNGDGTGLFRWQSRLADTGMTYQIVITATRGGESAQQVVHVAVNNVDAKPQALDVVLHTGDPSENPALPRDISPDAPLTAEYTYFHPRATEVPHQFGEGSTTLIWFRNGNVMPQFLNQGFVPATATHPGDNWNFVVYPETAMGIQGDPVSSPIVTVVLNPVVHNVSPGMGHIFGGTVLTIRGENLGTPLRVKIGGIPAVRFTPVSDTELTAIAPAHPAGLADVVVETPLGTALLANAFNYMTDSGVVFRADVNRDGFVDAVDVQLVINVLLQNAQKAIDADVNADGKTDAADVQTVVNVALRRN